MLMGRDDRSYVMGKTVEFNNFNEAEVEHFVESNKQGIKVGFSSYYSSPLWDKTDN